MFPDCPSKQQAMDFPWWGNTSTWFYHKAIQFDKRAPCPHGFVSALLLHVAVLMLKPVTTMKMASRQQEWRGSSFCWKISLMDSPSWAAACFITQHGSTNSLPRAHGGKDETSHLSLLICALWATCVYQCSPSLLSRRGAALKQMSDENCSCPEISPVQCSPAEQLWLSPLSDPHVNCATANVSFPSRKVSSFLLFADVSSLPLCPQFAVTSPGAMCLTRSPGPAQPAVKHCRSHTAPWKYQGRTSIFLYPQWPDCWQVLPCIADAPQLLQWTPSPIINEDFLMHVGKIIQQTRGGFLSSLATLSSFTANKLQSLSFLNFNS